MSGTLEHLSEHIHDQRWREVFLLTASLLHEATPLFSALQKSTQMLLKDEKILLSIQAWSKKCAAHTQDYKAPALRSLLWIIPLNLARGLALARDLGLDRDNAFGRDNVFNHACIFARDLTLNLALDLDHARDLTLNRIYRLHHNLDRDLARDAALALDHVHDLDLALDLNRTLVLDRALALNLALALDHARDSLDLTLDSALDLVLQDASPLVRKDLVFFEKSINKTNLLLITSVFGYISKKKRAKKRVEKLKSLLEKSEISSIVPSHQASDKEWRGFYKKLCEEIEKYLGLELAQVEEINTRKAIAYLKANQLFFDCLQVATVENRKAIENMILNIPDSTKETL